MHCDEARATLLDHLDTAAGDAVADAGALNVHLESCDECRALENDIRAMQSQARVWHEIEPPPWNPDPRPWRSSGPGRLAPRWLSLVQQWLPLVASTAALALAVGIYRQDSSGQGSFGQDTAAPSQALPANTADPVAAGPGGAEALLTASRQERRREMEALTALLKGEMDRRALETEQSLKYIISHQIESQRELESMRGRLLQTENDVSETL